MKGDAHLSGFRGLWSNRKHSNDATQEGSSSHGEEDNTNEKEYKIKYKILEASLPFVQEHGWTKNAISEGLKLEFKLVEITIRCNTYTFLTSSLL